MTKPNSTRLLAIFVVMSSCWHLLKRSWFGMVFGQYIHRLRILPRDFVWNVDGLFRHLLSDPYKRIGIECSFCKKKIKFCPACDLTWFPIINVSLALNYLCLISLSAPSSVVTLLSMCVEVLVYVYMGGFNFSLLPPFDLCRRTFTQ